MKKITSLLTLVFLLLTAAAQAQGTIRGTVVDGENGTPLPGVNVVVEGTTNGVSTDFDGMFTIQVVENTGSVRVSYVGFAPKVIPFDLSGQKVIDLGTIKLEMDSDALDEVIVKAYSLAIDRKTPVAVSTIKAETIENELGSQEFPEILKTTPGVYVTRGGGGFGDAELRIRGFNSQNVAVMINGIPVNDMENGNVYWSNWAGLSDVTSSMQVQRGLGAAMIGLPSIGGTVNIVTKSTDIAKGGNVMMATGNDGYTKYGFTLSTGMLENDWAATISLSRTTGEQFVDATTIDAYSYFINVAKKLGENHELSFTAFGAPQRHGQRQNRLLIDDFRRSPRGIRTNTDYGYKNGQLVNYEDNFYHKPQISLNHYWTINEISSLTTSVYASFGTGGGGGIAGVNKFGKYNTDYRDEEFAPVNFDQIVAENKALGAATSAETVLRASRNNHQWYGALSTYNTELSEYIDLTAGVDVRIYKGDHYTELTDLLGGAFFLDNNDENNPNKVVREGDKYNYYDTGYTNWAGVFAQAEYNKDALSAVVSAAANTTYYKRKDYFNYLDSDPARETDWIDFPAFSTKGGVNYRLDDVNNVFANVGYFERAPFNDAVFLNFQNDVNADAKNQKIFSAEVGYGFRGDNFRADLNVYRTKWSDRTYTIARTDQNGNQQIANILGLNQLHQGIELEMSYRPIETLTLTGMASVGDWKFANDINNVQVFDDQQNPIGDPIDVYLDGVKVGNSAQTTFALGADYLVLASTTVRASFNYAADYFASYDPTGRLQPNLPQTWEMPAFGLLDLGLTHRFEFGGFNAQINANVFNVLDTEYISDAQDGNNSVAETALVYYGAGRTYTVGAKINF
ncbi:TonB-dependent receptor [Leeuwenhoekiella sp. H156]|uniref:TonB-dependent receptor n=1 Tax=Leeuwenhoekiella sp. H156 TaxID=3450128 RepID=UPI003FA4871D